MDQFIKSLFDELQEFVYCGADTCYEKGEEIFNKRLNSPEGQQYLESKGYYKAKVAEMKLTGNTDVAT